MAVFYELEAEVIVVLKSFIWPVLVVVGVVWLTTNSVRSAAVDPTSITIPMPKSDSTSKETVVRVNQELARLRSEANLEMANPAEELTVWRRLSLALHGTIPSLEEIRKFEADQKPDRLERWLEYLLNDSRFDDYFAERLARSYVGVEAGQFLVFRRDRFLDWLTTQLHERRPYDEIVRDMISGTGVWTGEGEVNFITAGFANDEFDPNKLSARSVRAFLGQRMDCAQCHDHPFDHWKQGEFEGLTAYYGQVVNSLAGVADKHSKDYVVEDRLTLEKRTVEPSVPFHPEWLGENGSRREQLARWMTHPENQRFERAAANRVWALMFGVPFLSHRPVDDLPDPGTNPETATLDLLGEDFRKHGYDLRRLIRVIAATDAFRMSSIYPLPESEQENDGDTLQTAETIQQAKERWAVFPLIRLRPEQVIGAMLQANNVRTIDQNSHLFVRALRFFRENDFVDEFGDPGVDELQDWSGTISQALLRMNGEFSRELTSLNPLGSPGRVATAGSTPEKKIETIYLVCLTRLPTEAEKQYFIQRFEKDKPDQAVEDLYWTLFNSPEFSWNH
ncbi:DUF1549 domain-containing protein [Thalassoglobus polymorphus]|uniref:DUF1549 domain-containing protein n=1 Tax=Thalassoglobus polymorphus TaxID=2527994 RepID=UPI0011A94B45|nr:DUF1549 domain-containing protein [Thalassoglobus polymorphus]